MFHSILIPFISSLLSCHVGVAHISAPYTNAHLSTCPGLVVDMFVIIVMWGVVPSGGACHALEFSCALAGEVMNTKVQKILIETSGRVVLFHVPV